MFPRAKNPKCLLIMAESYYLKGSGVSKPRSIGVIGKSWGLFHVCKVREDFDKLRHLQVQVYIGIKPVNS